MPEGRNGSMYYGCVVCERLSLVIALPVTAWFCSARQAHPRVAVGIPDHRVLVTVFLDTIPVTVLGDETPLLLAD